MNGIICIDKPQGFTSFDVVAKLRGITKIRRIGHAGTLDPMATGVLPVFIGRATKACDMLPDSDKEYEAEFRLGIVTDTQDSTGKVLSQVKSQVTEEDLRAVVGGFLGKQLQIPPMYSAVKVDGKKLYDLARQGIEIERKPREIEIYRIELLAFDGQSGRLLISCSKGTYIRTICHDIGQKLGCGAVMTALRRTRAAGFSLSDCITIEEAQNLSDPDVLKAAVLPIDRVFSFMDRLVLNRKKALAFLNGVKLDADRLEYTGDGKGIAVFCDGVFLATAYTSEENGKKVLRCHKQFRTKEEL